MKNHILRHTCLILTTLAAQGAVAQSSFMDDVDDIEVIEEPAAPAPAPPAATRAQTPARPSTPDRLGAPAPAPAPGPTYSPDSAQSQPTPQMACSSGNRVTLNNIANNATLAANLKAFMNGTEFREGEMYTRQLEGRRKDPAACAGLFGSIDLAGCQKVKPAGLSRFMVSGGEVKYLADGKNGPVPITLTQICSDGVERMTFKFHYHRTFLTVTAGPWDYTITVFRKDGQTYSNISAKVVETGKVVKLNKAPIRVGRVEITRLDGGGGPAYAGGGGDSDDGFSDSMR